jgi:hypothetical protein
LITKNVVVASSDTEIYSVVQGDRKTIDMLRKEKKGHLNFKELVAQTSNVKNILQSNTVHRQQIFLQDK